MPAPQHFLTFDPRARRVRRQPHDASQRNGYWVFRETTGAWFRHGRHEIVTRPGDLIVADADTRFETRPANHDMNEPWLLAKSLLGPHLPWPARPWLIPLSGRVIAADYLDMMTSEWHCRSASATAASIEILCWLIGVACGIKATEGSAFFFEKKNQKTFIH